MIRSVTALSKKLITAGLQPAVSQTIERLSDFKTTSVFPPAEFSSEGVIGSSVAKLCASSSPSANIGSVCLAVSGMPALAALSTGVRVGVNNTNAEVERGPDPDLEYVELARAGDLEAFRQLVTRYQSRAFSVAIGIVGRKEDAEDIVQEAFLKVYRNLGSFRGQSSFYTWLYRIVFNLSIDLSRRRYRRSEASFGDSSSMDAVVQNVGKDASDFMATSTSPDMELDRVQIGKRIALGLEKLSPAHRAVIVLREIDGLSYTEISDVVGCSKGTVMSRLHHARKKLQQFLASDKPEGLRLSDEIQLGEEGDEGEFND